jgi:hypothetical protein
MRSYWMQIPFEVCHPAGRTSSKGCSRGTWIVRVCVLTLIVGDAEAKLSENLQQQ